MLFNQARRMVMSSMTVDRGVTRAAFMNWREGEKMEAKEDKEEEEHKGEEEVEEGGRVYLEGEGSSGEEEEARDKDSLECQLPQHSAT